MMKEEIKMAEEKKSVTIRDLHAQANAIYTGLELGYKLALKTRDQEAIASALEKLVAGEKEIKQLEAKAIDLAYQGTYKDRLDPIGASGAGRFKFFIRPLSEYIDVLAGKIELRGNDAYQAPTVDSFLQRIYATSSPKEN